MKEIKRLNSPFVTYNASTVQKAMKMVTQTTVITTTAIFKCLKGFSAFSIYRKIMFICNMC